MKQSQEIQQSKEKPQSYEQLSQELQQLRQAQRLPAINQEFLQLLMKKEENMKTLLMKKEENMRILIEQLGAVITAQIAPQIPNSKSSLQQHVQQTCSLAGVPIVSEQMPVPKLW